MDARDFFRGIRPWDQFYNYVKTLAVNEGSQFWAAQLDDDRFDAELEKELENRNGQQSMRPSLVGYSRLIAAIDELTDHIYTLRAETGRWATSPRPRPKPRYPRDRIDDRKTARSRGLINSILDEAHALATP